MAPDEISWNAVLSACEPGSLWQTASELLKAHRFRDEVSFNTVISSHEKARKWCGALFSLEKMCFSTLEPSKITLDATAHALQKSSEWRFAVHQVDRTSP